MSSSRTPSRRLAPLACCGPCPRSLALGPVLASTAFDQSTHPSHSAADTIPQPPAMGADEPEPTDTVLDPDDDSAPGETEQPDDAGITEFEQRELLEAEQATAAVSYTGQDFDIDGLVRRLD